MIKKYTLFICCFLIINCLSAQKEKSIGTTIFNQFIYNPAATSINNNQNFNASAFRQRVNIDGAPFISTLNFQSPLKNKAFAVGLTHQFHRLGFYSTNSVKGDFRYSFATSQNSNLSLGARLGYHNQKFQGNALVSSANLGDYFSYGLGAIWNTQSSFISLAIPYMSFEQGDDLQTFGIFSFGKKMKIFSDDISLLTSLNGTIEKDEPLTALIDFNTMYYNKLIIGIGIGSERIIGNIAFNISKKLTVGYNYTYETGDLGVYNSGSHLIFLNFNLNKSKTNWYW